MKSEQTKLEEKLKSISQMEEKIHQQDNSKVFTMEIKETIPAVPTVKKETELQKQIKTSWNSDDDKDMDNLAKETAKNWKVKGIAFSQQKSSPKFEISVSIKK